MSTDETSSLSTDQTSSPEVSESPPKSPPKQGSLFRIILIGVLVLAVVALIVDRRQQSAAEELNNAVGEMLDAAPTQKRPTVEEVHEKIGEEPSTTYKHDEVPNTIVEEYRFRAGLPWRAYTVYVYYREKPEQRLYSVSLNQPEQFR